MYTHLPVGAWAFLAFLAAFESFLDDVAFLPALLRAPDVFLAAAAAGAAVPSSAACTASLMMAAAEVRVLL